MVFLVTVFWLGLTVRRPRRKPRTKKVREKGGAHIALPMECQCWRRLLLIHLAPAALVMFKKIHRPWDIHMKMIAPLKKGKHKEKTPGTSEARSQEGFQLLPKPLGHLLLEPNHQAVKKPKQKGSYGEEPRPWLTAPAGQLLAHGNEPLGKHIFWSQLGQPSWHSVVQRPA